MKRKSLAVLLAFSMALMFACNAATIQAYINLAVQIALQIAQLAGAPKSAADKVAVDLASVNKLITDYNSADANAKPGIYSEIDRVLTLAQTDLNDIFTLTSVKDAKMQAAIRAALAIGVTAIESIRAIAIKNGGPTVAGRTARVMLPGGVAPGAKIATPSQLKNEYNLVVSDYPGAQLK